VGSHSHPIQKTLGAKLQKPTKNENPKYASYHARKLQIAGNCKRNQPKRPNFNLLG